MSEFLGAQGHRMADARRDDRHLDAVGLQALQAQAVMHVEHLGFAAVLAVVAGGHRSACHRRRTRPGASAARARISAGEVGEVRSRWVVGCVERMSGLPDVSDTSRIRPRGRAADRGCSARRPRAVRRRPPAGRGSGAFPSAGRLRRPACRRRWSSGRGVISSATVAPRRSTPSSSSARRRSPSVNTPSRRCRRRPRRSCPGACGSFRPAPR